MARNYVFAPGEYYHIYARGYEKLPVFRDSHDYERFIQSLYLFNSEKPQVLRETKLAIIRGLTSDNSIFDIERGDTLIDIGAYCLMPNHFHILVHEKKDKGISRFMQKLMTSYTMYFNKKNKRTGAVFGSSFKARHVTNDVHLKYLFAYIHLNPKELTKDLKTYPCSSYIDYLVINRPERTILNKTAFPNYFGGAIENEMKEWLSYKSEV